VLAGFKADDREAPPECVREFRRDHTSDELFAKVIASYSLTRAFVYTRLMQDDGRKTYERDNHHLI